MNISLDPGVSVAIIAIVSGFTLYSFLKGRHLERLQQIEKGVDPNGSSKNLLEIKFGSLFIGVGFGILLAYILTELIPRLEDPLYSAFIFLFGGIGLIISYFIVKKIQNKS